MTDWSEPAAWYDVLNPWGPSDDFHLDLIMSADRVLDVGCGTGTLLHRARDAGHTGRLCGLDPDPAMLDRARVRTDIEWRRGDAASAAWEREFDLALMSGHAFQVFIVGPAGTPYRPSAPDVMSTRGSRLAEGDGSVRQQHHDRDDDICGCGPCRNHVA